MSSRGFRECILLVDQDGAALTNTTTQTSILPTNLKTAGFPIGYFDRVRALAFSFSGRITIPASSNTLALSLRLGTTDVLASGAMPMNVNAKTNVHWVFSGTLINRTFGSTGSGGTPTTFFPHDCKFVSEAVVGSPTPTAGGGGHGVLELPVNTAPAVGSGIDNGLSCVLDVMATWGQALATYSITMQAGFVDVYS